MERMFIERTMEKEMEEMKQKYPDKMNFRSTKYLERHRLTGPDGKGFDSVVTSPTDFKAALIEISHSWTKIKTIRWKSEHVPLLTQVIENVEQLRALQTLSICPAACEEDFFTSTKAYKNSEELSPPS